MPFSSPGNLSHSGIEHSSPALQVVSCFTSRFFTAEAPGRPNSYFTCNHLPLFFTYSIHMVFASQYAQLPRWQLVLKNLPANGGDPRDSGSIPGLQRSPGIGNGNPLQSSCLENSMDRGVWWTTQSEGSQSVGHNPVTNTFTFITFSL